MTAKKERPGGSYTRPAFTPISNLASLSQAGESRQICPILRQLLAALGQQTHIDGEPVHYLRRVSQEWVLIRVEQASETWMPVRSRAAGVDLIEAMGWAA